MTNDDKLALSAVLAAHQLLVRELIVIAFARFPDPLGALASYRATLKSQLSTVTAPQLGAAKSDLASQLVEEEVDRTLGTAEKHLRELLNQSRK